MRKFIAEIDQQELAIRLMEIGCKVTRPAGTTTEEVWAQIRANVEAGKVPADIVADFEAMAAAAIEYFGECTKQLQRVQ